MENATRSKTCSKCGEAKPLHEFHQSRTGRDGRRADCKQCRNAANFAKWKVEREAGREARRVARAEASDGRVKECIDCRRSLPILEFYALKKSADGRHPRCRDCFLSKRTAMRNATAEEKARKVDALRMRAEKFCGACGETKARDQFAKRARSRDGMAPWCKSCQSEWARAHYRQTRESRLEQSRQWYEANRDRKAATAQAWREANLQRETEARNAWLAANPDYMRNYQRMRRAKIAGVTVLPVDLDALWNGLCGICGEALDRNLAHPDPMSPSIDHIFPIARGGAHSQDNLQWAHLRCNISKGARVAS